MKVITKFFYIYLISTIIFILRHIYFKGWDFSVYVLNAKYLFDSGFYFEINRPPLMSFIIDVFSIFGWTLAEYLYIILISGLLLYSSIKLAESLNLDKILFYLFSLNSFVLLFGLVEGTELLALALLELFIAFLIKNKWYSGFFLGLACLTRYPFVIFLPLILFQKTWKDRIISSAMFVLAFIPWFIYNKIAYGNIFYSIADSFALNIIYRDYIVSSINYMSILYVGNILLPLILIGIIYWLYKRDFNRNIWIIICSSILIIYSILNLKADIQRYYIPLTIIFVFFSVYAMRIFSSKVQKIIIVSFIVVTLLYSAVDIINGDHESFDNLVRELKPIENCSLMSNIWVPLNYEGRVTEPFPDERALDERINEGYYVLLWYNIEEPDYIFNDTLINSFNIVEKNEDYVLIGNGCHEIRIVNQSYLQRLNENLMIIDNYTVSDNPYEILISFVY